MKYKILHKRRRQQGHRQQQPEESLPHAQAEQPSSTPVSSDDGRPHARRGSTFGSLERQFSGLSLRTSFSRARRSRSPPPPYTPTASASPAGIDETTNKRESILPAEVAVPSTTSRETNFGIDAITVVEENRDADPESKTATTVDITAVAETAEAERAAESLLLDVATAPLGGLPPPSPVTAGRLGQPVVIPRLYGGATVPFARGYAPCLGDTHGIDAATFLAFIDGLNLVTSPHPAALALSVVAFSMNFVPHDYANAVGAVSQLLADVATSIVAHRRAQAFLGRANTTLFEPRRLHASIVKTKRLRTVLGIAPKTPLLAPLSEETLQLATLERCMHHLNAQGWAASVELEARTGCLMPIAKPVYRKSPPPDPMATHRSASALSASTTDDQPPPLERSPSTWSKMGRSVNYGLAVVADKRVRFEIKKAEKKASRARRRAWKRHNKGKKLKEPFGEKYRMGQLSWIIIRNLEDVQQENAQKEAEKAARKAGNKETKKNGTLVTVQAVGETFLDVDEKAQPAGTKVKTGDQPITV